jgi:hypothetical protein
MPEGNPFNAVVRGTEQYRSASNSLVDRVQRMSDDETFTREEILHRFRKAFGREMTAIERRAFFLPPEPEDKTEGQDD